MASAKVEIVKRRKKCLEGVLALNVVCTSSFSLIIALITPNSQIIYHGINALAEDAKIFDTSLVLLASSLREHICTTSVGRRSGHRSSAASPEALALLVLLVQTFQSADANAQHLCGIRTALQGCNELSCLVSGKYRYPLIRLLRSSRLAASATVLFSRHVAMQAHCVDAPDPAGSMSRTQISL